MKEVKKKQMSLLDNISKNGFNIREVSKSPLIYNVNDNTVNIKTKQTFKDKKHGKEFWYGVYKSVLKKSEYTMIQMVDNNSFLFIPSDFLLKNWLYFYSKDNSQRYQTFMIEWDSSEIVANKRINIDNYYCNIEDKIGIIFKL
jgi:hypothetical protein